MSNFLLSIIKKIISCLIPVQKSNAILIYKNKTRQTKKITVATKVVNHKNNLLVKKDIMPGITSFLLFKRKQKLSAKIIPFNAALVTTYFAKGINTTARK